METKDLIKKILLDNIKLDGLAFAIIDEALEPALKKVVAESENKLDDMLMASIYPVLEEKLKEVISEKLAELMAPKAE